MGITDGSFVCSLCGEPLTRCGLCGEAPLVEAQIPVDRDKELWQQERSIRAAADKRWRG